MKKLLKIFICLMLLLSTVAEAQTGGKKGSEYPVLTTVPNGYYFFLFLPGVTNASVSYQNLQSQILTAVTSVIGTNVNSTNITAVTIYATYNTNLYAYITNLYSTNIFSTNIFAVTENITYSTNIVEYSTNIYSTNIVVTAPGDFQNLNLTPKALMWSDAGDFEASIPDGVGILYNAGSGAIGWSNSLALLELDAQNAYLTNVFTFLTNAPYLSTDGNGQLIKGAGLSPTNILLVAGNNITLTTNGDGSVTIAASGSLTITTITNTTIYSQTNFSTNLFFVSGKGNTLIITNVSIETSLTNKGVAASSIVSTDANQVETNAVIQPRLAFTANALDLASGIVTPGTYLSVTVDTYGRVTAATVPTTFTGTATLVTQPAILSFASDSNSITMSTNINNVYFFVANKAVSLTNVIGAIAGQMTYADFISSNSLATSITNFETIPGAHVFGVSSPSTGTNAVTTPAGKEVYWHIECRGINETNVFVCVQQ